MVRNDPKLPDDSDELPKPNEAVGGSVPDCGIVSLLDGKLARWSSTSCIPKKQQHHEASKYLKRMCWGPFGPSSP